MIDKERLVVFKKEIRQMVLVEQSVIREEGEPIWVEDLLISFQATNRPEALHVLEDLIKEGHVRPGTRFDELALVVRKLLTAHP